MSHQIRTTPGSSVLLHYSSGAGLTGLTVTAKIYDTSGSQVGSDVTLTEVSGSEGEYIYLYSIPTTSNYEVLLVRYFPDDPVAGYDTDYIYIKSYPSGGVSTLGGKADIDEKKIKIIAKEVFKLLKPELDKKSEFNPKSDKVITEISFGKVDDGLKEIKDEIQNVKSLIPPEKDYLSEFSSIRKMIATQEKPQKIDIKEIYLRLDNLKSLIRKANNYDDLKIAKEEIKNKVENLRSYLPTDKSTEIIKTIKTENNNISNDLNDFSKFNQKLEKKMKSIFDGLLLIVDEIKDNRIEVEMFKKQIAEQINQIILCLSLRNQITNNLKSLKQKGVNNQNEILSAINNNFRDFKNQLLELDEI